MMTEIEFRQKAKALFGVIEKVTESVDPDKLEVIPGQGSLTLVLNKKSKVVLSLQAPVRQMWLALAHKGEAHHFNWNSDQESWFDDKGKNLELKSYLNKVIVEQVGFGIFNS
jgi:iron donor protein CyaY